MKIAVVVLDTLRKDAFDEFFDWLPGRRFENFWAPSHWTVPVHGALFTGRYGSEIGTVRDSRALNFPEPTLAERLHSAGFTTHAFSANPLVSKRYDFDRGFDVFSKPFYRETIDRETFDWLEFSWDNTDKSQMRKYLDGFFRCLRGTDDESYDTLASILRGGRLAACNYLSEVETLERHVPIFADDGAREALDVVESMEVGDREYLFMNLLEPHDPYEPPPSYRLGEGRPVYNPAIKGSALPDHGDVDSESMRDAYDDCVRYLADVYEEIFARLVEEFDYVFTLADHGELFGEHSAWSHDYGVYPELTHVPLVVSSLSLPDGTDEELRTVFDVHQTVLDLADAPGESRGRNLFEDGHEFVIAEYHGLTHTQREWLEEGGCDKTEIERWDTPQNAIATHDGYYGYETIDGFEESGTTALSDPHETLRSFVDGLEKRTTDDEREEIPDALRDQLEELGYA